MEAARPPPQLLAVTSLSLIHTSSRPPSSPHHFMMCLICRFSFYLAFTTSIRWRPPNDVSVLQFASKIPKMSWHPPRPKMHKLYYFAATALPRPRAPSVAPSFDSFLVGWQSESVRRAVCQIFALLLGGFCNRKSGGPAPVFPPAHVVVYVCSVVESPSPPGRFWLLSFHSSEKTGTCARACSCNGTGLA